MHFILVNVITHSSRWDSGFWHQRQRRGHPIRKNVVRMPGAVVDGKALDVKDSGGSAHGTTSLDQICGGTRELMPPQRKARKNQKDSVERAMM